MEAPDPFKQSAHGALIIREGGRMHGDLRHSLAHPVNPRDAGRPQDRNRGELRDS